MMGLRSALTLMAALLLAPVTAWADAHTRGSVKPDSTDAGASATADAPSGPPLWEIGAVAAGGYGPTYPASSDYKASAVPIPYIAYRGRRIRAGDGALLRGIVVEQDRFELDVSLDGSFNADSSDSDARDGMPDLDFLVELGPRVQMVLARDARASQVELELPLRAVFSLDWDSPELEGFVFNPQIAYQNGRFLGQNQFKAALGPVFGTEGIGEYFYEVAPRYARAGRPAFDATGGYLGSRVEFSLLRRLNRWVTVFGRVRAESFHGAANNDSPLFEEEITGSVMAGLVISVLQSKQQVPHR